MSRNIALPAYLGLTLFIAACSGDGRPLQEAVETNNLGLKEIIIEQPSGLLPALVVNPGALVPFKLSARNQTNQKLALSAGDRRWSVDNSAFASIDENGRLTAIANGDIIVKVQIGGLSATFPVEIQQESLVSINEIVGEASLDRCVPSNYSATGQFSEGSTRGLLNATWDIVNDDVGSLGARADGQILVIGVNVDTLQLVATLDGVTSSTKSIEVKNTLQGIDITPNNLAIQNGNTLGLGATGNYLEDGISRKIAITNSVQWRVPVNNGVVTIGNTASNKGFVTTIDVGNTQVTASCGNLATQKPLVVIERGSTSTTDLTISGSSPRTMSLAAGAQQLLVSTGSVYNSDDDVSTDDETTWEVIDGSDVVTFSATAGINTLIPLKIGVATVRATYRDASQSLDIEVVQ